MPVSDGHNLENVDEGVVEGVIVGAGEGRLNHCGVVGVVS